MSSDVEVKRKRRKFPGHFRDSFWSEDILDRTGNES